MATNSRRYQGIIFFVLVFVFAGTISAALYLFKIKKNEEYQNQLHFRELREAGQNVVRSLEQLHWVAKTTNSKPLEDTVIRLDVLAKERITSIGEDASNQIRDLQITKRALLAEIEKGLSNGDEGEVNFNDLLDKKTKSEQQVNAVNRNIEEIEYRLWDLQDLLTDQAYSLLDDALNHDSGLYELISKDCNSHASSVFCSHISQVYEDLIDEINWEQHNDGGYGFNVNADVHEDWLQTSKSLTEGLKLVVEEALQNESSEKVNKSLRKGVQKKSEEEYQTKEYGYVQRQMAQRNATQQSDIDLKKAQLDILQQFTLTWTSIITAVSGDQLVESLEDKYISLTEKAELLELEQRALNVANEQLGILSNDVSIAEQQLATNASETRLSDNLITVEGIDKQIKKIIAKAEEDYTINTSKSASEWKLLRLSLIKKIEYYDYLSGTSVIHREQAESPSIVGKAQQLVSMLPAYDQITPETIMQLNTLSSEYLRILQRINLRHKIRLVNGSDSLKRLNMQELDTVKKRVSKLIDPDDVSFHTHDAGINTSSRPKKQITNKALIINIDTSMNTFIHTDDVRLNVPTQDFIPDTLTLFPMVLIAQSDGDIVANKQSLENSASVADLRFTSVLSLLRNEGDKSPKSMPEQSTQYELSIGGINYRIYVQPLTLPSHLGYNKPLMLIGLTPISDLRLEKLSIFPTTAMWMLLLLLILMAIVPILKVRFMSPKRHFTSADVTQTGFALLLLMGVLSVAISEQFFFSHFQETKLDQARQIYRNIRTDFADELTALREQHRLITGADTACEEQLSPLNQERKTLYESKYVVIRNCENPNLVFGGNQYESDFRYMIEGHFHLNDRGMFPIAETQSDSGDVLPLKAMRWLHKDLYLDSDLLLNYRQYFQKAIQCDLWGAKGEDGSHQCDKGFFIERINNVRDARKVTQLSFANYSSETLNQHQRTMSSIGSQLRTFFHRVLPKDVGYAVLDDKGKVVYHSDNKRAMLEDMVVETNNNGQLRSLLKHGEVGETPVDFSTTYRNDKHQFVGGNLHDAMPWKLVVFYKRYPVAINNLLLIILALGMFVGLLIPLFLGCRYAVEQVCWSHILRFNYQRQPYYDAVAVLLACASIFAFSLIGIVQDLSLRLMLWLSISVCLLAYLTKLFSAQKHVRIISQPYIPFAIMLLILGTVPVLRWESMVFSFDDPMSFVFAFLGTALLVFGIYRVRKVKGQLTDGASTSTRRYSQSYVLYLIMFLWVMTVVPSAMIVNSANSYLLQYQAHGQSEHLIEQNDSYNQAVNDYFDLVRIENREDYIRTDWLSPDELNKSLVYIGDSQWITLNPEGNEIRDPLMNLFVRFDGLGPALDPDLYHMAKVSNTPMDIDATKHSDHDLILTYDANRFMFSALEHQLGLVIVVLLVVFAVLYYIIRDYFVERMLGEHIPENFRSFIENLDKQKIQHIQSLFNDKQPVYLQIQRATPLRVEQLISYLNLSMFEGRVLNISRHLEQIGGQFSLVLDVEQAIARGQSLRTSVVVIEGLDNLAAIKEKRLLAHQLLAELMQIDGVNIILVCEENPLFKLCHQSDYPDIDEESYPDSQEVLIWANLLAKYVKVYDWSPRHKSQQDIDLTALDVLAHEIQGWPELADIGQGLEDYHRHFNGNMPINESWSDEQIVEYFLSHADSLYRTKWQHCTKNERVALYQIASGCLANPGNAQTLIQLVKRGYLYRDGGWFIANRSFGRFILSAEKEDVISEWLKEANSSIWQYLRIPIMIAVVVLVIFIVFSTGQTLESVLAVLTAILGLVPLLLRNMSLFRGGSS